MAVVDRCPFNGDRCDCLEECYGCWVYEEHIKGASADGE